MKELFESRPGRFDRVKLIAAWSIVAVGFVASAANAAETVSYTYDAKGRLVAVARSGGPATGVQTTYSYDAADNRTNVTRTGSASNGPIVVPLNGYTLIPRQ